MLDSSLPISLQYQLRTELINKIENGEWIEGKLIPSERELCAFYGVSRITVREVLKELVANGLLIRKQGLGTFVQERKIEATMTTDYSLKSDLENKGKISRFIMLSYEKVDSKPLYQDVFHSLEPMVEIERLRLINDKPYAKEKSVIPAALLKGSVKEEVDEFGLYPTIKKYSGIYPEEADEIIEAVNSTEAIAQALDLKRNAAVIKVIRKTLYKKKCIEYCESYISGIRYNCHKIIKF